MSDEAKLQYIEEYKSSLHELCRNVATEVKQNGEKAVNALLDVGAATLAQLRIGVLSYAEQLMLQSSRAAERAAVYEDCVQAMRSGADCDALWRMEADLRARLKSSPWWSNKIWTYIGQGLKVASESGRIVLSTVKEGVLGTVRGAWQLFQLLLPYILRMASYVFTSPRAAVLSFLFAKQVQRNLCRYLSRTFLHVPDLPPKSAAGFPGQLKTMARLGSTYMQNIGMSQIVEAVGREVHRSVTSNSGVIIDTGVTLATSFVPGGSLVAPFVGGLLKGAVAIGAEAASDAAEFAVYHNDMNNAFNRLFEILSLQECRVAWSSRALEAARYARYQQNRSRIENMSADDYRKVRSAEIYKDTPGGLSDAERKTMAQKQAEEELDVHRAEQQRMQQGSFGRIGRRRKKSHVDRPPTARRYQHPRVRR